MRIHLIRHGETRHNAEGRVQGHLLDDPLNEVGRAQAEALSRHYATERLRGLMVSAVYASPLLRAHETASRVAEALDLPAPGLLPGLREISWGSHMGRLNEGATRDELTRVLTAWENGDLEARAHGGESPGEAWMRAQADLKPVLERHAKDDIVVVAHGRMNKILLSGLVHGHLHEMEAFPQSNAAITIVEGPPWRVVAGNSTKHIDNVRTLEERAS